MSALLYIASGVVGTMAWDLWPHRSETLLRRDYKVTSGLLTAFAVALCLAGYFWEQGS